MSTVKVLIIAWAFTFHYEGGGHLLEATVFDNGWKNFERFKFLSNDL